MALATQTGGRTVAVSDGRAQSAPGRGRVVPEADFTQSGDVVVNLPALSPGTRVQHASLQITGKAFHGLLKDLSGASITASPVSYDSSGVPQQSVSGQQAFLVDFTGLRSVLGLELKSLGAITLVLPWAGTEFSGKSAYPQPAAVAPFVPIPHGTGAASVGFAGMDTTKLLIQVSPKTTAGAFAGDCRIVTGTFPSNLKASINKRPAFFTRPGVLNGTTEVTGMADELNALAAASTSPQVVQVTIATDTPGVLLTQFDAADDLDAQLFAAALFGGQESLDVNLDALAPQSVSVGFPAASPASWALNRLEFDLAGTFPPWRAFSGQSSGVPGALGFRVNAQFSVARRFPFAEDGDLFGFSLLFRAPAEAAQMHLDLVADDNGQPGASPAVAAIDVDVPVTSGSPFTWVNALFRSPVKISAQKVLWLALRAKTGSVEWAGSIEPASPEATTLLNNEGGRWQTYPMIDAKAPVAMVRVLRRPFNQENQLLLTLTLQSQTAPAELVSGVASTAIAFAAGAEPVFPSDGVSVPVALTVAALASGTLTIRKARAYYREVTA